jgi:Ca2+-binding EF-hand superfamily protein
MTAFSEADRKRILESLTPDELATFKEAFTVFDKNNDGTITTKVHNTKFRYFFAKMSIHYWLKSKD